MDRGQVDQVDVRLNAHPLTEADGARLAKYGTDYTKVVTSTCDPADRSVDPQQIPAAPAEPGLANPTPAFLATLPADPGRLLALLRADAAGQGTGERTGAGPGRLVFDRVASFATTADALLSPELRSALYRVLAGLPGVQRVPGLLELAGRTGVAIAGTDGDRRTEIIIDPVTSRTIGFRVVALTAKDGPPAGTVVHTGTAGQKIVERAGDR